MLANTIACIVAATLLNVVDHRQVPPLFLHVFYLGVSGDTGGVT